MYETPSVPNCSVQQHGNAVCAKREHKPNHIQLREGNPKKLAALITERHVDNTLRDGPEWSEVEDVVGAVVEPSPNRAAPYAIEEWPDDKQQREEQTETADAPNKDAALPPGECRDHKTPRAESYDMNDAERYEVNQALHEELSPMVWMNWWTHDDVWTAQRPICFMFYA